MSMLLKKSLMNLTKRQTTIVLAVASVSLVAALALLLYYFFVTNVKEEDIDFLAQSAMDDACRPGNPKDPTKEDIIALYKSLL